METVNAPGPSKSGKEGEEKEDNPMFECNICLDTAKDAVVSMCGHLFCWPCLHQWLETRPTRQLCPVCKAAIGKDKVIPLYGRGSNQQEDPRNKVPPRPAGQRSEPENNSGFPGFGFGDGGFHMSFGIGAFPFGFITSSFHPHDPRPSSQEQNEGSEDETDEEIDYQGGGEMEYQNYEDNGNQHDEDSVDQSDEEIGSQNDEESEDQYYAIIEEQSDEEIHVKSGADIEDQHYVIIEDLSDVEIDDQNDAEIYNQSDVEIYNQSDVEIYNQSDEEIYDQSYEEIYDQNYEEIYDQSYEEIYDQSYEEIYDQNYEDIEDRSDE